MTRPPNEYSLDYYVVICPQMFNSLPPGEKRISFQMEQSISTRWFTDDYLKILKESMAVLDFSLSNIESLKQKGISYPLVYYVPIGASAQYAQSLPNTTKEFDVLFYGDYQSSQRRQTMLQEVFRKFNTKAVTEVFGLDIINN